KKKIQLVSMDNYTSVADSRKPATGTDKIAVIYASGSIGGGEGDDQSIGSERISKAIRKAREDEKVKAIVFRINSGGGSALASDVIWREVELAKKVKPVVASFGDVAASGGYYIACAATKILADPSSITGSIGVFGVIPNMEGLFNKKLGVTFDWAMTNKNGDYIPVMKPLSKYQTLLLQRDVDHIYDVFTGKVAEGRNLKKAQVDSIGQGRV
ncbi:MAG: S49 family peptidase, partial [Bacteroidetes bacterium]|nr:S49 family peptidase [Bacteroidota bacterium]